MSELEKAARMALEALERSETTVPYEGFGMAHREAERKHQAAIAALRQALAEDSSVTEQPAQQSRMGDMKFGGCPFCGSQSCVAGQCQRPAQQESEAVRAAWMAGYTEGEREAIEKAHQQSAERVEPVAWTDENFMVLYVSEDIAEDQGANIPLYTRPQAREPEQPAQDEPLTDAQIGAVAADIWGSVLIAPQSYQAFARAIEAAHGIKGDA